MKNSAEMHDNSAGYNGYFYKTNTNALERAKMPEYEKKTDGGLNDDLTIDKGEYGDDSSMQY